MSPFPETPFTPLSRATSSRLDTINAALNAALSPSLEDPSSANIEDLGDLPIAIVALDDDGGRPLTGQHHIEMFYCGSMLKLAALYAAYQLRVAVNDLAATLDVDRVKTAAQVFAELRNAFNKEILGAVPLINTHKPPIPDALKVPTYDVVFQATQEDGRWVLDFHQLNSIKVQSGPFTASFTTHLNRMIVGSHNESAGVCVRSLGYSWINGVLQAAGFLDLSQPGQEGIWLAGDYENSPTVEIQSVNDKLVKQVTTCYHMAWLLTELFDHQLVRNEAHPISGRTGNDEMLDLLGLAVMDHGAPSRFVLDKIPGFGCTVPAPFDVLQSKIGVGQLKVDPRNPPTPGNCNTGRGCVSSEAAILQHSSGRKYVVVFENVLDGRCRDFERIANFIQTVMDNDHP